MYSYTAPQANGDGPVSGGGGGGELSADDFSEPTANGTYQSMATGVRAAAHSNACCCAGSSGTCGSCVTIWDMPTMYHMSTHL